MSAPMKPARQTTTEEEVKKTRRDEDEYMSDASTATSASEEESDYSESEDDEILFDFSLSLSNSRRILKKGDCVNAFAIDVISEAAKLGAEIKKKSDSIRIVGNKFTLKFSCSEEDGEELIGEAFDEISADSEASDEAKLLAFVLTYVDENAN